MPFGLTNTPATFQSCMNHVFNKQLKKFLLVFFDDILIYNKTWEDHLRHLDEVLGIIEGQQLYVKESKCKFGMKKILYLGHMVGKNGVQVHQENIRVIIEWPTLRNVTELKRFLRSLTDLIGNLGDSVWIEEDQDTFEKMKQVMSSCPVLSLLDFTQPFVLECDAS
jgi:hypothetical protein